MSDKNETIELLEAIGVCCELTSTQLSEASVRAMADDLSRYSHRQVMGALSRCRRELKARLTLADVLSRLDDGRPGPQEAWSIVAPTFDNEAVTIVWTEEMAEAFGICRQCDSAISGRMAFLEAYASLCQKAREAGKPVRWMPCLGHDKYGRDGPLLEAIALGRLDRALTEPMLIGETAHGDALRLSGANVAALTPPRNYNKPPELFKSLVDKMTGKSDGATGQ